MNPPLLAEIFRRHPSEPEPIRITAGVLATSLGITVAQLSPLIREGYLVKRSSEEMITSKTVLDGVPLPALQWMKTWFQPVGAKPLFGLQDVADLLGCLVREVIPMASAHDVPVYRDPALGFCLSIWSTRQLILRSVRARDHATRHDRQALLWLLLEKDPERAVQPPVYEEEREKELARIAKLPEPTRSLRALEILEALQDAKLLAEGVEAVRAVSPCAPPASENGAGSDRDSSLA